MTHESKLEAYKRFLQIFKDEPGFVAATRPEDIPESLRVQAEPGSAPSIRADLIGESIAGIVRFC